MPNSTPLTFSPRRYLEDVFGLAVQTEVYRLRETIFRFFLAAEFELLTSLQVNFLTSLVI